MTSSLDMIRGRSNVVTLTNNSGGALIAGDVCVQDTSADEKATTTTSAASTLKVFIAAESIASGAAGKFYSAGHCPLVTPNASVTRGRYLFTHTVAKQAAESATYGAGAFGVILKSGTTPSVWLFGSTAQGSGGGVARSGSTTDGHLAVWNGSDADSIKDGGVAGASETPWLVQIIPYMPPNAQTNWTTKLTDNVLPTSPFYAMQSSGAQNDYIEFKGLFGAGTWELSFVSYKAANSGIYTVAIDGSTVATVDGYNGSTLAPASLTTAGITVADVGGSAIHLLRFTMATKNGSSSGYYGNLYMIQMRRTA